MKKRNANIELLRIVAMMFIIMHHLTVNGYGLQQQLKGGMADHYSIFLSAINSVVIIGVNIFFLISGYYGIRFEGKKLAAMVVNLYVYADVLLLLAVLVGFTDLSLGVLKNLCLPFYNYWFIYVYLFLYLLSPILNKGIESMSKNQALAMILILTGMFCVVDFVLPAAQLGLNRGYSLIFAIYLYLLGRVMRIHGMLRMTQGKHVLSWILSTVITAVGCGVLITLGRDGLTWRLFSYNQLFVVIASVNFVWWFLNLPQWDDGGKCQKLAKHILPVYYIHTSTIFGTYRNVPLKLARDAMAPWWTQVVLLVGYAMIIFAVCVGIDVVKCKLWDKTEAKIVDLSVNVGKKLFRWVIAAIT